MKNIENFFLDFVKSDVPTPALPVINIYNGFNCFKVYHMSV